MKTLCIKLILNISTWIICLIILLSCFSSELEMLYSTKETVLVDFINITKRYQCEIFSCRCANRIGDNECYQMKYQYEIPIYNYNDSAHDLYIYCFKRDLKHCKHSRTDSCKFNCLFNYFFDIKLIKLNNETIHNIESISKNEIYHTLDLFKIGNIMNVYISKYRHVFVTNTISNGMILFLIYLCSHFFILLIFELKLSISLEEENIHELFLHDLYFIVFKIIMLIILLVFVFISNLTDGVKYSLIIPLIILLIVFIKYQAIKTNENIKLYNKIKMYNIIE